MAPGPDHARAERVKALAAVATVPVFVALIAVVTIGERLAALRWLGILVALAGVALLTVERSARGSKSPSALGDLAALLAALSFAAYTVGNKRLVERVGALPA